MAEQSWHTCKYARGNLHPDIAEPQRKFSEFKLLRAVLPEQEWEKTLGKKGINQLYLCKNPSMIGLAKKGIYQSDGFMDTKRRWVPYVILFKLNLSGYYEGVSGDDPFDKETGTLDFNIRRGLRACANCRYYKKAQK
ncbi:MAG: hypothetical protein V1731_01340 [Candidatus Aenigmatarchaeota archaeon]